MGRSAHAVKSGSREEGRGQAGDMEGGVWLLPESLLGLLHRWEVWIQLRSPTWQLGDHEQHPVPQGLEPPSSLPRMGGHCAPGRCPGSLRSAGKVCDLQPFTGRSTGQRPRGGGGGACVSGGSAVCPEPATGRFVTRSPRRQAPRPSPAPGRTGSVQAGRPLVCLWLGFRDMPGPGLSPGHRPLVPRTPGKADPSSH